MRSKPWTDREVEVEGEVIYETALAWLLNIDGDQVWLPKSQVEDHGDGTFTVPEWLALERGLI